MDIICRTFAKKMLKYQRSVAVVTTTTAATILSRSCCYRRTTSSSSSSSLLLLSLSSSTRHLSTTAHTITTTTNNGSSRQQRQFGHWHIYLNNHQHRHPQFQRYQQHQRYCYHSTTTSSSSSSVVNTTTTVLNTPTEKDVLELFKCMNNRPGSLLSTTNNDDVSKYNTDWTVSFLLDSLFVLVCWLQKLLYLDCENMSQLLDFSHNATMQCPFSRTLSSHFFRINIE